MYCYTEPDVGRLAMDWIKLRCPATTANLGPGYDVFGLALEEPYDILEVAKTSGVGIRIEVSGYPVPSQPEANSAGYAALNMLKAFGLSVGLEVRLRKGIKPGSGLGSSAAAAAGMAYALNKLFNLGLEREALVEYASQGEVVAAGTAHADNVAPAIFGGFIIVVSRSPLKVVPIRPPRDLGIAVALPSVEKGSTKIAREAVPKLVPVTDMNFNVGHAALLAAGMALGDISLIKQGMEDRVVEPARARAGIVREYKAFKRLAKEMNAGIAVSGAGPAMLGITETARIDELAKAMKGLFEERGYRCEVYTTRPGIGVQETTWG
ncbi:MAG: homoserine kinase [Candidatus Bathyarchaeia archaeon]